MEKLKKYSKIHKNYILKNKNIPVLSFQLEEIKKIGYSEYALKHINIINKELLPFNLKNPDKKNLEKWISHRKAPKNRKYMNLLLSHSVHKYKLDTSNIMNYIDFSFIRHPNYNLDDKILVKGENFIKKRAEKLLELLKEKTCEIQEEVQINKRSRSRSRCRSGNER
ncbi:hypothetical protein [Fusobacterium sp. HC1336]|uniref:hypothetical protein n=1 Tax=Fusobacterium sp. HC1336 TaxID=3171169 RepID=UPI003F29CD7A